LPAAGFLLGVARSEAGAAPGEAAVLLAANARRKKAQTKKKRTRPKAHALFSPGAIDPITPARSSCASPTFAIRTSTRLFFTVF
jgi:hypothetical protein